MNMKQLKTTAGCFGYVRNVIQFDMDKMTPEQAMTKMTQLYPDHLEGSDCEVCGYDYPSYMENYNVDESSHEHSLQTCGHEKDYERTAMEMDELKYPDYPILAAEYCSFTKLFEPTDEATVTL